MTESVVGTNRNASKKYLRPNIVYDMNKREALAKGGVIFAKGHYGVYGSVSDHAELLSLIKGLSEPRIFEYIAADKHQTLYFDIDFSREGVDFSDLEIEGEEICLNIHGRICEYFPKFRTKFFVLASHQRGKGASEDKPKFSAHLIIRLYDGEIPLIFSGTTELRETIRKAFGKDTPTCIDMGVYKTGGSLMRTIYSSKPGQNRPLYPTTYLSPSEELLTFITYEEPGSQLIEMYQDAGRKDPARSIPCFEKNEDVPYDKPLIMYTWCENKIKSALFERLLNAVLAPKKIENMLGLEIEASGKCLRIRFKGFCVNAKRSHRNNYCLANFDERSIRISCFKQGCGNGRNFRISEYISRSRMLLMINLEDHITRFIHENTDPGVRELYFENDKILADSTDQLNTMYVDEDSHCSKHIFSLEGYKIVGRSALYTVSEFESSEIYALFTTRFSNAQRRNINVLAQVNNYNVASRLFGSAKKPDLSLEDIQALADALQGDATVQSSLDFFRAETLNNLYRIYETMDLRSRYRIAGRLGYRRKGFVWLAEKEQAMRLKILREIESKYTEMTQNVPVGYEYLQEDVNAIFDYLLSRVPSMPCNSTLVPLLDEVLRDDNLDKMMNGNWNIIPFENGLFNLETGRFDPEDTNEFFSFTVGYSYEEMTETPEIDEILSSLMPDPDTRNYILEYLACALSDKVPNDFCLFVIGRGCNGKSLFSRLIAETFGPMFRSVPSSLFSSRDDDPHSPKPVLQQLRYARVAILAETDEVKFRAENFKRLCGNETHTARQPHGMLEEFAMKTKFIIFGNDIPEFSTSSRALWRRMRILRFDTQFVDEPLRLNEKKIDRLLYKKIETDVKYRKQFMSKLVQIHRSGVELIEPKLSKDLVKQIRTEYDEFYQFCEIYVGEFAGHVLTMGEILRCYRPGENHVSNSDFYRRHVREFNKWLIEETTKFGDKTFVLGLYRSGGRPTRGWKGLKVFM